MSLSVNVLQKVLKACTADLDQLEMPSVRSRIDSGKSHIQTRPSDLLGELVAEGIIPPVEERVGPEPVVQRGVEGVGQYGGTWFRVNLSNLDIANNVRYMSGDLLARWSPIGYPIVPHVARKWEPSSDYGDWTFFFRKGMKWSDGHPFTTEDILYWWDWDIGYFEGKYAARATETEFKQNLRI